MKVTYSAQPLVRQITAEFTTEFGTTFQICASADTTTVHYGTRSTSPGSSWSYGTFRFAEGWRERNGWPPAWPMPVFKSMIEDFLKEEES